LLVLLLARCALLGAGTNAVPVFHASLKAASEAAAAEQSLVLMIFGAEWCGPCKQLKAKTLASREFLEQGGALRVAEVDVDAEPAFSAQYGVNAVPTLVLLTPDNKIVARTEGFLDAASLLRWLGEGRERARQGKWEGVAPGSKVAQFAEKAAGEQLTTNDVAALIALLGDANSADRDASATLLMAQREAAVLPLIEALTNSYLGVRIAAAEALHALAPDAAMVDAWQSPAELAGAVGGLKQWWTQTGKLPPRRLESIPETIGPAAVTNALENLRDADVSRRTEAMSTLVKAGSGALPALRGAIKRAEKAGDQRSLSLLEDVLWAILIPDTLEQGAAGMRTALARGKSLERQAATARLGALGRPALPALAQLADDSDPLVVENALRALSQVGGKDVVPAMAGLLKAGDSNLRMTAAQALGHAKNPAALPALVTAFNDPNEVVACAALAAVLEINGDSDYSGSRKALSPDVVVGLKSALADPRWRVRAAAVEVIAKTGTRELSGDVAALLADPDGFVVKNALEASETLSMTPDPGKLEAIAARHPGLREMVVQMLVRAAGDDSAKAVANLYEVSPTDGRAAIIRGLGIQGKGEASPWTALLTRAAQDHDPQLRRAAAESLAAQPPKIAASIVTPLLADDDAQTRAAAAGVVLCLVSGRRETIAVSHGSTRSQFLSPDEDEVPLRKKAGSTNAPAVTPAQLEAWHSALQQKGGEAPGLVVAAAIYVTGPSNAGLPALERALARPDKSDLASPFLAAVPAAVMPRLPWPEGKNVLERLSAIPALYLPMTAQAQQAAPGARDFLLDPARFRAALDSVAGDDREAVLHQLLDPSRSTWSLASATPGADAIIQSLLNATNAAWRAAAVHALGARNDARNQPALERALSDTNGWVRAEAVNALSQLVKDRPARERLLAPLLNDSNKRVARLAAISLLEPETVSSAQLQYEGRSFEFENIHIWSISYEPPTEQRPLAVVEGKPAFLDGIRASLTNNAAPSAPILALLLAQYGDASGLEMLVSGVPVENRNPRELDAVLLTAIGLLRDAKYMPYLKSIVPELKDETDLRRVLQGIKGIPGPEARQMRVDINKRLRQSP
jgi:HEAT repeat protein